MPNLADNKNKKKQEEEDSQSTKPQEGQDGKAILPQPTPRGIWVRQIVTLWGEGCGDSHCVSPLGVRL